MASPLVLRSPQCMSCVRRTLGTIGEGSLFPAGQQIRGKKKAARTTSKVNARLLEDVDGYGKKGAVIGLTGGVMRNQLFPKGLAEYATASRLRELGMKEEDIIQHENSSQTISYAPVTLMDKWKARMAAKIVNKARARANREAKLQGKPEKWQKTAGVVEVRPVELDLLQPDQAMMILDSLVPPNIEFYRAPIVVEPEAPRKISPSIPSKAITSVAASEGKKKEPAHIYGSVSTGDIVASLKAILAEDKQGSRVTLSSEDVSFVAEMEEKDRVKNIGIFDIDIKIKGASNAVRRSVQVYAQI